MTSTAQGYRSGIMTGLKNRIVRAAKLDVAFYGTKFLPKPQTEADFEQPLCATGFEL